MVAAIERVGDELLLIREILDELRTDFQWAVQNGRVVIQQADDASQDSMAVNGEFNAEYEFSPRQDSAWENSISPPDMPEPGNLF